jgi:hypothetical protein
MFMIILLLMFTNKVFSYFEKQRESLHTKKKMTLLLKKTLSIIKASRKWGLVFSSLTTERRLNIYHFTYLHELILYSPAIVVQCYA